VQDSKKQFRASLSGKSYTLKIGCKNGVLERVWRIDFQMAKKCKSVFSRVDF
jgi:hypothetical protein